MAPRKQSTADTSHVWKWESINVLIWAIMFTLIYRSFSESPYLFSERSEDIWLRLLAQWPFDHRILYFLLSWIFSTVPFLATCLFYDAIYKFNIFTSYRIQTPYSKYPESDLVKDTIFYDLMFMGLYIPLGTALTFNRPANMEPIPNLWTISWKLMAAIYGFDIFFYFSHRLLHIPALYKHHKLHHEYKTTICWTATWSSIVELMVSTMPSSFLPIVILRLHPATTLLYYVYRNVETCVGHSGYDLPFYVSPLFVMKLIPGHYDQEKLHDYHHSHNNGCFGFYFIDALFGTNEKFVSHYYGGNNSKKPVQSSS